MYMHKLLRPCLYRCSTFNNYTYNTTHVYGQYFSEKKTRLLVIVCVFVCVFLYLVETLFLVPRSGRFNTEPHHGTRLKSALCHKCQKWFEIVLSLSVFPVMTVMFIFIWSETSQRPVLSVRRRRLVGRSVGRSIGFFFTSTPLFTCLSLIYEYF